MYAFNRIYTAEYISVEARLQCLQFLSLLSKRVATNDNGNYKINLLGRFFCSFCSSEVNLAVRSSVMLSQRCLQDLKQSNAVFPWCENSILYHTR